MQTEYGNHKTLSRRRVIACGGCGKKLRRFRVSSDVGCQDVSAASLAHPLGRRRPPLPCPSPWPPAIPAARPSPALPASVLEGEGGGGTRKKKNEVEEGRRRRKKKEEEGEEKGRRRRRKKEKDERKEEESISLLLVYATNHFIFTVICQWRFARS